MITLADVDGGQIEQLARALQAQLSPLLGTRAAGKALVTRTGGAVVLPRNAYAFPILANMSGGESGRPGQLVKVAPNPATAEAHNQGGAWTIGPAGTEVDFVAQVGGSQWHAITAGQKLRWDPLIEGLDPEFTVTEGFAGGTLDALAKLCTIDLEIDDARDLLDAGLGAFPALVVGWLGSSPVEGRTAGLRQGGTRKRRDVRVYHEAFAIFVVSSSQEGRGRRRTRQRLIEAVRNVLSDHSQNEDGEDLSVMGTGVEILDSVPVVTAGPNASVGLVQLRVVASLQRTDVRTWTPWTRTSVGASLPASEDEDAPAEQQEPLTMVDGVLADMPQDGD